MTRVLSGRELEQLRAFLAAPAADYDADAGTRLDPYDKILSWAQDPEHGGLPLYSARPFAEWLNHTWGDWTDDECVKVEQLLKGAVEDWCGGRTF